jgi:predicted permease
MKASGLLRAALALVPEDWRAAVARDLEEDTSLSTVGAAAHAVAIGVRLRVARGRDRFTRPSPGRITIMREFTRDLTFAIRSAVRRPGYALAIVATLAIGIGANTAIYSVFNWVLFRPIPGASSPSELITILFQRDDRRARFFVSYRDVADLRDGMPALSELAASTPLGLDLAVPGGGDPERTEAEIVTANYFRMFGVAPAPGRDFRPDEERPITGTPPAIISRSLWKRRFDASPAAIGQTLVVNGHSFLVAGVAPSAFQGRSHIVSTDLWVPIGAHQLVVPNMGATLLSSRGQTFFGDAFGRLRPGQTVTIAQQQATAVADATPGFARRDPKGSRRPIGPIVYEGIGQDMYVRERLTTMFRLVMGAVGLVLLLACANAANLLLARAVGRRREIAVCQAIGASRFRIIRQQLAEGLVLAVAAGGAGLALAIFLTSLFDGMRLISYLPAVRGVYPDVRVVVFTTLISVATGLVFALAPAIATSRTDLASSLKDGLTMSRGGRSGLRSILAVVQVAVSIVLLICAGLFARTLSNLRAIDLGLEPAGVVSFSANPPRQGYSTERAKQYFVDIVERLRATPGIASVAYSWTTPYLPNRSDAAFKVEGGSMALHAASNSVSTGFFQTLRIPIVAGRDFTEADWRAGGNATVAIASTRLARELVPNGSAVGTRLVMDYPKGQVIEIVGIAGDVRGRPLSDEPEPQIYFPAGDATWGVVHVRTADASVNAAATIRAVARDMNPQLPPYDVEPFAATIDRVLTEQRVLARLGSVFAAVGALLAAIGIYGMMACAVGERMREFGIRLALGARAGLILRLVLRNAIAVTAAGLVLGLAASWVATRGLQTRLYGLSRHDPLTVTFACVALLIVAVAASALPAWRASQADPVKSLRVD